MKIFNKLSLSLIVVIVGFLALYGLRTWRMSITEERIQNPVLSDGLLEESITVDGVTYLIPPSQIYESGFKPEDIPALNNPTFDSLATADAVLADGVYGVVVEVDGEFRFYSYQVLNWHTVVNDEFNGMKLAVTMCAFCRSAVVYYREFDGQEFSLQGSGKVYNNNTLLTDGVSDSLWSQIRGTAVSEKYAGKELTRYPAEVMTWAQFKERYPKGEALSVNTGFVRDYTRHPYGAYDNANILYFPLNATTSVGGPKWLVNTVNLKGEQLAFADIIMKGFTVHNDVVGGEEIVGFYDAALDFTRVYSRKVDNQVLTFVYDKEANKVLDQETGSEWNAYGVAVDGELKGSALMQYKAEESFWFCAYAAHPDTRLAKVDENGDIK